RRGADRHAGRDRRQTQRRRERRHRDARDAGAPRPPRRRADDRNTCRLRRVDRCGDAEVGRRGEGGGDQDRVKDDRFAMQVLTRTETIATIAQDWLAQLETALAARDDALLASLFLGDSYWRDVLALTWRIGTTAGAKAIVRELGAHAARARPIGFELA